MRIYHGSNQVIARPKFGAGRAYNDFGLGFYCTKSPSLAAEWAVGRNRNGFVSVYSIDTEGLRIIDLSSPRYNAMHWLRVLLDFREFDARSALIRMAREYISRNFFVDYQGSDCIAGYRADDCLFTLAQDFLNGRLSYQCLSLALKGADKSGQFVLKSNRALDRIIYVGYEPVQSRDYYVESVSRELGLLKEAYSLNVPGGLFISQMIDEEVKSYDPRL